MTAARIGRTCLALLAAAWAAGMLSARPASAAAPPADGPPSRLAHFITRRGDALMDGEQEFRFLGANMPGLIMPYDFTLFLPERMVLPTPWEQEDGVRTLNQMNLRVARLWLLPMRKPEEKPPEGGMTWHYVQGPGRFNDESFKVIDNVLALGHRYGIRFIVSFSADQDRFLGGIGTFAAHRGKRREAFFTDPQLKDDYKAVVRHVLLRRNTLTGTLYKDDPAILAWQFGNEIVRAPEAWLSEMAAYMKGLDPNHLVIDTRHQRPQPITQIDPNIDIYTRHFYPQHADWIGQCREELKWLAGRRPLIVGEYGPYFNRPDEAPQAVADHRRFLEYVRGSRASGALIWSMYFHHRDGGFYWHQIFTYAAVASYHWPGFPSGEAQRESAILADLRQGAFAIQGLEAPPLPVPAAPFLLPIGEVPRISWRGSTGASGYDLQRAPGPDGPWTTLAADLSDAETAYRPLFCDATATAGEAWHYRVLARNASGTSGPSNLVGPVRVTGVCLADELGDFSRVHKRSDGLSLVNVHNALYAEYLYRAKGDRGQWVEYRAPSDVRTVQVVAFFAGEAPDLALSASADGQAFAPLAVKPQKRALRSPPGGVAAKESRVMALYEAPCPEGTRHVRIEWQGPAELDRVELVCAPPPARK